MRSVIFVFALLFGSATWLRASEDKVIPVHESDAAMNAAIADARTKLPLFWTKLEKPDAGERDFNLKVRIEDKHGVEHFWCSEIQRKDGHFSGIVNNDPRTVKSVALGERVDFTEEQISDWLFMRGGKMIGNYTLRPLMRDMSKDERSKLDAMLGPLP